MTVKLGEEFSNIATPSPALLRKLAYLATKDTDSVLTGSARGAGRSKVIGGKAGDARGVETVQLLAAERSRQLQIQDLNNRLDQLAQENQKALELAKKRLEEMRENANRTRDGRLVFRDKDGQWRGEDGSVVDPDHLDKTKLNPNAPSYEDWEAGKRERKAAEHRQQEIETAREKAAEGDLTQKELDDLDGVIGKLETGKPGGPHQEAAIRSTSASKTYQTDPALNDEPKLRESFAAAATNTAPPPETPAIVPPQPSTAMTPG